MESGAAPEESVRLDVWLDVACVFATRSRAKAACDGGKVDINGRRARPHHFVRPGDRLEITIGPGRRRHLVVRGLSGRSMRKADARRLYEDVTPPPSEQVLEVRRLERLFGREESAGRPERNERRERRRRKGW